MTPDIPEWLRADIALADAYARKARQFSSSGDEDAAEECRSKFDSVWERIEQIYHDRLERHGI